MSCTRKGRARTRRLECPSVAAMLLWSFTLFTAVYFVKAPRLVAASVRMALEVCASRLIPSLFAFTVVQRLFIRSGLADRLPLGWLARIYGLPRSCGAVILLGAIGGFPSGAIAARELYETGELDRDGAARLTAVANNAGLAFCVGGIGEALYNDAKLGWILWLSQLAVGLVIGRLICGKCAPSDIEAGASGERRRVTFGGALGMLADSVSAACTVMVKICGFAVFFAVIGDLACTVIGGALMNTSISAGICAAIGAVLELTLGTRLASELGGKLGLAICGFAAGFGGLSVQAQIASVLTDSGISGKQCLYVKLAQGILCTVLALTAI